MARASGNEHIIDREALSAEAALNPRALKFPEVEMKHAFVMVQPIVVKKSGKIFLTDKSARENKHEGIVVAVGPGRLVSGISADGRLVQGREPMEYAKGDRVILDIVGTPISAVTLGGVDYFVTVESGIVCKLPPLVEDAAETPKLLTAP